MQQKPLSIVFSGTTVANHQVRPGDIMSKFYGESQRRVQVTW